MCSNESLVPTYDVSLIQVIPLMALTDPTGFCGKDRPQVGVIVITKEPAEDGHKPAIGRQLSILFGKSYLVFKHGSGVPSLPQAWQSHTLRLLTENPRYRLERALVRLGVKTAR